LRIVLELTFLGTGTSTGVPLILCDCPVCTSSDPRDARLRASVLVRSATTTILIDTSPDLRAQLLQARPPRIDGVLYTHSHADHTAGLDELRRYNILQRSRIPIWATEQTGRDLTRRFDYAFDHSFSFFGGKPDLDLHPIEPGTPFTVGDLKITPIAINHGRLPIVGFRIGNLAYVTDVKTIPESSLPLLEGLDTLILTALRQKEHVAHLSLSEALDTVEQLRPTRTYLTHIAHELGRYLDVGATLPQGVELAVDGLTIELGLA
jgi:phosphoribosyl 1,2-cyclic phosphate phosphodiesterase